MLGQADDGDSEGEEQPEGRAEETKETHQNQDNGALEEKRHARVTLLNLL